MLKYFNSKSFHGARISHAYESKRKKHKLQAENK